MHIQFLKAYNGDSIWIRYWYKNRFKNIIIDGGTSKCYASKNAKQRLVSGELKTAIEIIKARKESVDLLIITHVDDDHIGGIIKWFENDPQAIYITKEVWFNSSTIISQYFGFDNIATNEIGLDIYNTKNTSTKQGDTLEKLIEKALIWKKELVFQGQEVSYDHLVFQILSPNHDGLKKLNFKWIKETSLSTSSTPNDYSKSIQDFLKRDIFIEDDSVHNASSIAFILITEQKKLLFLADSHPQVILEGLKLFGYSEDNPLEAEFVKLPHHGSKKNLSIELLSLIKASNFVISSNGDKYSLPDKQCLSRIIGKYPNVNLLFNYPDRIKKIFSSKDFENYNFNSISIETGIKLNEDEK